MNKFAVDRLLPSLVLLAYYPGKSFVALNERIIVSKKSLVSSVRILGKSQTK